jgi:hypothetical protein
MFIIPATQDAYEGGPGSQTGPGKMHEILKLNQSKMGWRHHSSSRTLA